MIEFRIEGHPKAQPRPRRSKNGGVYNPPQADGWKETIYWVAKMKRPKQPFSGPVSVTAIFLFDRPQRLLTKSSARERLPHTSKPDRDNLEKALLDVLTNTGFWRDDAQVCSGSVSKYFVAIGERPGVIVKVEEMNS